MGVQVSFGLRPMTLDDIDVVAAMEASAQPMPWSVGVFGDELAGEGRAYLVAEDSGQIVGFGGIMVGGADAHVTNLLVRPESRGRGVGTSLMVGLIAAAIDLGAKNLTLEVRSRNDAARKLYSRFGLAPVGARPGYYGDDDALILWAYDIDSATYQTRIEELR